MPPIDPLLTFLDAHHVAHLATSGEGGPHAAPVFFARWRGAAITWISAPHVLHARHLGAEGGACAASVSPSAPPLGQVEGVQLRGRAHAPPELQEALRTAWLARFPAARAQVDASPGHRFYVLEPAWARLIGTVAGAPRKQEWRFDGAAAEP